MKNPFKRNSDSNDRTEIRILTSFPSGTHEIYVNAKTSEKALKLIEDLQK